MENTEAEIQRVVGILAVADDHDQFDVCFLVTHVIWPDTGSCTDSVPAAANATEISVAFFHIRVERLELGLADLRCIRT